MYSVTEVAYQEWTDRLQDCEHVNLVQSWQYGVAKELAEKWRAVRFLIRDDQGRAVALAQFLARELPFLGGAARMNRGPLLLGRIEPDQREVVALAVLAALVGECRRRRWWMIQVAPEIQHSESAVEALASLKLRRLPTAPAASGLVSLERDDDQLLMELNGKWRNCLRKGLRSEVSVACCEGNSPELGQLLPRYRQLQEEKGFGGIPDGIILALAAQMGAAWGFTLFVAGQGGADGVDGSIGMLVSVRHGDTSTYLIGSTNETGRRLQANYVLLWRAMQHAKNLGCRWFDIGGLNATTPQGIAHFKQGINAIPYTLVGEWRRLVLPIR